MNMNDFIVSRRELPPVPVAPAPGGLDRGIAVWTNRLRTEFGIETCQSCEGGPGHAYPVPTVDFRTATGTGACMIAVGACLTIGLPVASVSLVWNVSAGGVHEVVGRLEFSRQNTPEELEEGFRMWGMVDHRQWATQTPEEAP